MDTNKLGIIILNYNTWNETVECVRSIQEYTSLPYTIYIVDNGSTDDSLKKLGKQYQNKEHITVMETGANRGYSAGNNAGIKRAVAEKCDVIFIVNSDVELLNDAFARMTATLLQRDSFMMVGPSVMNNNQEESQLPRRKQTFKCFLLERHPFCKVPLLKRVGDRGYPIGMSEVFEFSGSVSGCCFGMRADDFVDIGYLDEGVFLYSEEDILAYKMEARGKKAVVDMKAQVWHKENVSTNKKGRAFVQFHRWNSILYLLKEYAKIGKPLQIFVAVWNTATWMALSIVSGEHRKMLRDFCKEDWKIVFKS